ncbi:MAG: hypothetical protein N2745_10220 [Syntrophorhabdaceae bacterium]|nr:hypothetical protein [Syntrophorhabdaceae bacterium]
MKTGYMNDLVKGLLDGYGVDVYGFGHITQYDRHLLGLPVATGSQLPYLITFGLLLSRAVMETTKDGPNLLYLHHYRQLNYRLDMIGYLLAGEIEKKGYRAMAFPASQLIDWRNQKGHISHKHTGVASGLGWIGRNNLLIHPKYGAYVRYNTVLTEMPLDADTPLERGCGACRACIDVCPAGAIKESPVDFDHKGCYEMITQLKNKRNIGHHICGICVEPCRGER